MGEDWTSAKQAGKLLFPNTLHRFWAIGCDGVWQKRLQSLGCGWLWQGAVQEGVEPWTLAGSRVHSGIGVCVKAAQGPGRTGHGVEGREKVEINRSIRCKWFFSSFFLLWKTSSMCITHRQLLLLTICHLYFFFTFYPLTTPYLIILLNILM